MGGCYLIVMGWFGIASFCAPLQAAADLPSITYFASLLCICKEIMLSCIERKMSHNLKFLQIIDEKYPGSEVP